MRFKNIRQNLYSTRFRNYVDNMGRIISDSTEHDRVNRIRERWMRRLDDRAEKANRKEHNRNRAIAIAGLGVGTVGGGALGYALSKRATKDMVPSKKRTAIRIGSAIAGTGLGGYAAVKFGNKYIMPRRSERTLDLIRRANLAHRDYNYYNS